MEAQQLCSSRLFHVVYTFLSDGRDVSQKWRYVGPHVNGLR